jgi:hypothetical protein
MNRSTIDPRFIPKANPLEDIDPSKPIVQPVHAPPPPRPPFDPAASIKAKQCDHPSLYAIGGFKGLRVCALCSADFTAEEVEVLGKYRAEHKL